MIRKPLLPSNRFSIRFTSTAFLHYSTLDEKCIFNNLGTELKRTSQGVNNDLFEAFAKVLILLTF